MKNVFRQDCNTSTPPRLCERSTCFHSLRGGLPTQAALSGWWVKARKSLLKPFHPTQAAVDQIGACLGKAPTYTKLDTVSDFLTELGRVVEDQSAVIVLEGAERLREEGSLLQVTPSLV